jgi:hypothetical protein
MANTKISQLPIYTGNTADLRWFIMNNSGETETFKYSGYTSQLIPGTGTGETYRTPTATASGSDSIAIGDGASHDTGTDGIAIGKNASATSNRSTAIGGTATSGGAATALGWGCKANGLASVALGYFNETPNQYALGVGSSHNVSADFSTAIGGNNYMVGGTYNIVLGWNTALSSGSYNTIINGLTNTITSSGNYNAIVAGQSNTLGANTTQTTLTAGYNNNVQATILGFIGGTQDNTITSAGYTYALIGGGYNTINATNASAGNAMYSSYFCSDTTINDGSVIGSSNNWFSGARNCSLVGYGKHNHITNSYNSTITNSVVNDANTQWFNKIDSSSASTITTSSKSQILGGESNTILDKTNVVMIGTSGRTASASNTTYVENLRVFRQAQYGNFNNGSRATNYTIDWNNGNIQKVVLTGSCVFSATNITDGTTYIFKVSQDNSGNRAATWSSGIFKFANSTPPTLSTGANAVDIFTFVAMDGLLYGVAQLNFG